MSEYSGNFATASVDDKTLIARVTTNAIRDADTSYGLRDEVATWLTQSQAEHLVLDVSAVRTIGSIGLMAFLGLRRQLPDGRIILCHLSDPIRDMLVTCRLIRGQSLATAPLEDATDLDEALDMIRA